MTDDSGNRQKKEYEPPKVTMISLRPEEAVLGNCKSANGACWSRGFNLHCVGHVTRSGLDSERSRRHHKSCSLRR